MESTGKHRIGTIIFSATATVLVLAGQMTAYPAAVRDIVHLRFLEGVTLKYPAPYTFLAPLFQLADRINILSVKQIYILFAYINAAWLIWRIIKRVKHSFSLAIIIDETIYFTGFNAFVLLCIVLSILLPRPLAAISVADPDIIVLDFHTHTSHSWDGRKTATPANQMKRRMAGGFDAFFIIDHNNRFGVREAKEIEKGRGGSSGAIALEGEEISASPANLIVLGPGTEHYSGTAAKSKGFGKPDKALKLVQENKRNPDTLVIATSTARWWSHPGDLESIVRAGLDGIDVTKASPKGLDLTVEDRSRIIDFARKNALIMTGSSDNHGFGYAEYVWNLLRLQGWQDLDPFALEQAVIHRIRQKGPDALTIVTRVKAEPTQNVFLMAIDPLRQVWEMMRSLPPIQALSFITWVWIPLLLRNMHLFLKTSHIYAREWFRVRSENFTLHDPGE